MTEIKKVLLKFCQFIRLMEWELCFPVKLPQMFFEVFFVVQDPSVRKFHRK